MRRKLSSVFICILMVTSVSASITQNVGQTQNAGQPQIHALSSPSPTSGGTGGLADSPWPMFRQNLNHTGLSPYDTSTNNGQLKWSFMTGGGVYSSPAIDSDETIYFGSYDHKLYAINPDGSEKWNFATGGIVRSSPVIGSGGTIYVGSHDNKLYAINSDGSEKWNFTTGGEVRSSPTIGSDGTIYVGSWDHKVYAINPDGTEKWSFKSSYIIDSSPAISSEGTIYFGSYDCKLYALNLDGTEKWNFTTGGQVRSSPAIGSDGTIYIGSEDNNLYAINSDGTQKWCFITGNHVFSSPAIGFDGTIYVGSNDNNLYAINPDGTEKWEFTTKGWVHSSPAIGFDGTIYSGSSDDKLYAINPDGSEKWNYNTHGNITGYGNVESSPAIGSDGTIYVGSWEYQLYALDGTPTNQPPIANAGPDQTVNEANTVQFDGSASYDPDNPQEWSFKADVPFPTRSCGSTTLNGEIYYIGGIPLDLMVAPSSVFMKYDPASDSWSDLPDLPVPRAYLGAAAANGKIYAIGGSDGNNSTDSVFEFDPATNIWTSRSPLPVPMEAFGSAVVKDRIYVIGGSSTWLANYSCKSVFEYDTVNDSWSEKPEMLTGRSNLAAAVLEDKIYAIGGDAFGAVEAVEVYDPAAETWTKKANLSMARAGLCVETVGGYIYAFGGTGKWGLAVEVTEMYDSINNNWIMKSSMLEPRVYFGSGVVGNCMYAMGGSYGPLIVGSPNTTEEYCVGGGLVYEWDFDSSDGLWWETGAPSDAIGPTPTHVYGDDGVFIVTLRVIDSDNLSATDTCNVTVQNVNPTVTIESVSMEVEIGLRVAGRKYNNVNMTLYEDGSPIGNVSIERLPGSPDEQMTWIPVSINFSSSYNATVTYTPEDPPNIGGNPVWIYIKSKNGSVKKIHHTFNVQQSKKRDSEHWNHVEPWEVNISAHLIGCQFEVTSHVTDPGSDDLTLTYTYGSQVVTITYLNNPPNPDPYPSPEVNPMDIMDATILIYEGPGIVTLVVKDDDNIRLGIGQGTGSFSIG